MKLRHIPLRVVALPPAAFRRLCVETDVVASSVVSD